MTLMNEKLNRGEVVSKNVSIVTKPKPQQKRKGQNLEIQKQLTTSRPYGTATN